MISLSCFPKWEEFVRVDKYAGDFARVWGSLDVLAYLLTYPYLYSLSQLISVYYEPRWEDKLRRFLVFVLLMVPCLFFFTSMVLIGKSDLQRIWPKLSYSEVLV